MTTPDLTYKRITSQCAAILRSVKFLPQHEEALKSGLELCSDDKLIRNVIHSLGQAGSEIPTPTEFEACLTDAHFLLPVAQDNRIILYWFIYCTTIGDQGYTLFRISDFLRGTFNFEEFCAGIGLDLDTTIQSVFNVRQQIDYLLIDYQLAGKLQPVVKAGFMGLELKS